MGERIVAQLGLEDSVDTLGRWIAHRVAELLIRAEDEEEKAKVAATDLILRLWAHRSDWPQGWPPPETEKLRERLEAPLFPARAVPDDDGSRWLGRLSELQRLQHDEYQVWLRLALVEADIENEIAQAEGQADDLQDDELSLLRLLGGHRKRALEHFTQHIEGEDSRPARTALARTELDEVEKRRRRLFEEAAGGQAAGGDDDLADQ